MAEVETDAPLLPPVETGLSTMIIVLSSLTPSKVSLTANLHAAPVPHTLSVARKKTVVPSSVTSKVTLAAVSKVLPQPNPTCGSLVYPVLIPAYLRAHQVLQARPVPGRLRRREIPRGRSAEERVESSRPLSLLK